MTDDDFSSDNPSGSGEDHPSGIAGLPSAIVEAYVTAMTGVPPQVQRSFYKAVDHVFGTAATWTGEKFAGRTAISKARTRLKVAQLDAETAGIKTSQQAAEIFAKGTAKAAVSAYDDEARVARAFEFHSARLLRDQTVNEEVVGIAAEELRTNPPDQDSESVVDEDWLAALFKEAPTRTTAEYKTLFGRILAGEIKRPGTFSIQTIRTLAVLTSRDATTFQSFCNISTSLFGIPKIISDPYGQAGNNSLGMFGLTFDQLMYLVEAGLVRPDFAEWRLFGFSDALMIEHAEQKLLLKWDQEANHENVLRVSGPTCTAVGAQLSLVVEAKHSPVYLKGLAKWLGSQACNLYEFSPELEDPFSRRIEPA